MLDAIKETEAFHNIYKTEIVEKTLGGGICMKGMSQAKERCNVLKSHQAFKLPITI